MKAPTIHTQRFNDRLVKMDLIATKEYADLLGPADERSSVADPVTNTFGRCFTELAETLHQGLAGVEAENILNPTSLNIICDWLNYATRLLKESNIAVTSNLTDSTTPNHFVKAAKLVAEKLHEVIVAIKNNPSSKMIDEVRAGRKRYVSRLKVKAEGLLNKIQQREASPPKWLQVV